jgi:hypothetical protein
MLIPNLLVILHTQIERMKELIFREMDLEDERKAQFNLLVQNLNGAVKTIEQDILSETKIVDEMKALRSNLEENSSSAAQLDALILQKQDMLTIESFLLDDLKQCIMETKQAFDECEERSKATRMVLERIDHPANENEWADIDDMETILAAAEKDVKESELRVAALKNRIDLALIEKNAILRGSETRANARNVVAASQGAILKWNGDSGVIVKLSDLQETDILKQFAISIGNATICGGKATLLALKTLIHASSDEQVKFSADEAFKKTKLVSTASNETFKENASAALDAFVDTAKLFFEKASTNEDGKAAGENLSGGSKELMSAANAFAALGTRTYKKLFDRGE